MILIGKDSPYMSGFNKLLSSLAIIFSFVIMLPCINPDMFKTSNELPDAMKILLVVLGLTQIVAQILFRSGYKVGCIAMIWTGLLLAVPYATVGNMEMLRIVLGAFSFFNAFIVAGTLINYEFSRNHRNINLKTSILSKSVFIICGVLTIAIVILFFQK